MAEAPKPKRRLKNPETFRERAVAASQASQQPKRVHKARHAVARTLKLIVLPLRRLLAPIFRLKLVRLIGRILTRIGKILVPAYLRNSAGELKLVTWPTWQQSRALTVAVLIFAVIFGAVIATVDYGLDKVFKQLLLK